ncbi:hypothetical protein [Acinetobacter sp. SFA]|uniref:hypothetical protein n=1 Tax=Acinetobacter sp. SFA TaxID=1805633 RepID=UPI0007D08AD2|nr:hypothetical protein [Acinetobacter sp. SFA]OAL80703.1 hypothetical protein AY607_03160 [Acinetobacter sp. SFA]
MARRFGRNQKRAMRNQIINAEKRVHELDVNQQQLEALIQLKKEKIKELSYIANLTAEILGEYFAGLPVQTMEVKEIQCQYKVPVRTYCDYADPTSVQPQFLNAALTYIETYQSSAQWDQLRGMMHLRYRSENGAVGYGLSDMAWCGLSEVQIVELIQREIAPSMAILLTKNRKKIIRERL